MRTYETPKSYLQVGDTGRDWGGPTQKNGERLEHRDQGESRGEPPGQGAGGGAGGTCRGTGGEPFRREWYCGSLGGNEQGPTYV